MVSDDAAPSEEWVADVVFLCAEDDDLELVSVVHRAREERIGVEVLPGVDHDSDAILDSLAGLDWQACVLFCGKGFTPAQALGFRKEFQARFPNDELLVMELDTARVESLVRALARRLVLMRSTDPSGVQELPVLTPPSVEAQVPSDVEPPEGTEDARRSKLPLLLGAVAVVGALAFLAWTNAGADASPEVATVEAAGAEAPVPSRDERSIDASPAQEGPDEAAVPEAVAGRVPTSEQRAVAPGTHEPPEDDPGEPEEDPGASGVSDDGRAAPATATSSRPRSRSRQRGRSSKAAETPSPTTPENKPSPEPKPTPEVAVPPKPKPKRKAKLIEDGLLQTTD